MDIDKDILHKVNSSIIIEDDKTCLKTTFNSLLGDVLISAAKGEDDLQKIKITLLQINQATWDIETLFQRLEWQKELWGNGELKGGLWMNYASADIRLYHFEMRSIFDYLAVLLVKLAKHPGQVRSNNKPSFMSIKNWLSKDDGAINEDNAKIVGKDFAELVVDCDWFDDIRDVRDLLIHDGGSSIVFPEKGRILFQIYSGSWKPKIFIEEVMYNEKVVDFELYGSLYFSYLLDYLGRFAELLYPRLGLERRKEGYENCHKGLVLVKKHIERFLK